jgi:NAD(P)H-dependent flavin oxidoreductase YrpB (nitropropane dioxygenase family)
MGGARFETAITRMLGIEHPLIGGAMMWLSRAELVAAVSEAGGLGVLASAIFGSGEELRREIGKVRDRTERPFAVNLNMCPAMKRCPNEEFIEVILDEKVGIVETSGHVPPPAEQVRALQEAGIKVIHKCAGVRYARKAESLGVDAVTVVGYENGGAVGMLDVASLVLVPGGAQGLEQRGRREAIGDGEGPSRPRGAHDDRRRGEGQEDVRERAA